MLGGFEFGDAGGELLNGGNEQRDELVVVDHLRDDDAFVVDRVLLAGHGSGDDFVDFVSEEAVLFVAVRFPGESDRT